MIEFGSTCRSGIAKIDLNYINYNVNEDHTVPYENDILMYSVHVYRCVNKMEI